MSNTAEANKVLKPIYYGCFNQGKEYTAKQIEEMPQPFRNIHKYIREWRTGITKV